MPKIRERLSVEYCITQSPPTNQRPGGTFIVSIWANNQAIHVGSFVNLDVARIARNQKMRELGIKARPTVAGWEHLPDDLRFPARAGEKPAMPKPSKAGYPIESLSQKFARQQKEAATKPPEISTIARNYDPCLCHDDGLDHTPVYRYRGMTL